MTDPIPRRAGVSIRTRLLATIVTLMAAGLLLAGATGYSLEKRSVEREAAAQLYREHREFAALAATGVDPATRLPFASASALLHTAIQRRSLGPADGMLGVVGQEIEWTAYSAAPMRLDDHPELKAATLPHVGAPTTTQGRLRTGEHDFLYLVSPVRIEATGETGALVRAIDLRVATQQLDSTYRLYALVAVGVAALTALVVWGVMGRLLAPIAALRAAASSIGENDLTRRIPVRGRDDLSALTATMNGMLDRIETLVASQRQLADDVGHELRSPLTIIRGHLELMDPNDAEEVRVTRQLALEETDRMGRLTEDLILLATSEKTDYVVPETVELTELTDETLDHARALDDRPWSLDDLAEGSARLDPQRIRQAWLQLADNAVKYSPPGTPVALGSHVEGDEIRLWVRDAGPGVAPDERDAIVQRAVRGAASSGRRGRGLGLAIVTKIVEAHGGRLDIQSTPGQGSVFTMVLPRAGASSETGAET